MYSRVDDGANFDRKYTNTSLEDSSFEEEFSECSSSNGQFANCDKGHTKVFRNKYNDYKTFKESPIKSSFVNKNYPYSRSLPRGGPKDRVCVDSRVTSVKSIDDLSHCSPSNTQRFRVGGSQSKMKTMSMGDVASIESENQRSKSIDINSPGTRLQKADTRPYEGSENLQYSDEVFYNGSFEHVSNPNNMSVSEDSFTKVSGFENSFTVAEAPSNNPKAQWSSKKFSTIDAKKIDEEVLSCPSKMFSKSRDFENQRSLEVATSKEDCCNSLPGSITKNFAQSNTVHR